MACACQPATDTCECEDAFSGSMILLQKGPGRFSRSFSGWATTAGVVKGDTGEVIPTKDHEGEYMLAAMRPGSFDISDLVPRGYFNDSHTALLIGIPERVEFCGPGSELSTRDGKVGYYDWGHILDRNDPLSWSNPDGTPRMRMLKDGTVTDEPFVPTREELDRADWFWDRGLKMQQEGRTLGQSIQGRKSTQPCADGRCIVRARVNQIAILEYPHNPDATIETMDGQLAKGSSSPQEAPIVLALAARLQQFCTRSRPLSLPAACEAARTILRNKGIFNG